MPQHIKITLPTSAEAIVAVPAARSAPSNEIWGIVCQGRSGIAGMDGGALTRPVPLCASQFVFGKLHRSYISTPNDFSGQATREADEVSKNAMPIWGPVDALTKTYRGEVPIYVGNFALSGTSLANLANQTMSQWLGFVSWLDRFVAEASTLGKTPRIKALFWSHSNSNGDATYVSELQSYYAQFQSAVKSRTGQAEDVLWLWEQSNGEAASVDAAIIMNDDPAYSVALMDTRMTEQDRLDGLHFSSAGHLRMIERNRIVCERIFSEVGYIPFRMTALTKTGPRTIAADFQCEPDWTITIGDGWHGIEIYQDGIRLPQAAAAVTGPRQVTLTFPDDLTGALTGGIARTGGLWPNAQTSNLIYTGIRVNIGQSSQTGEALHLCCFSEWLGAVA